MDKEIETHPAQVQGRQGPRARLPKIVTMRAYEVYCHVFAPQEALVTGDCRGGMFAGELIAYLYARSFPQNEWRARVDEAFRGMEHL